MSTIIQTYETKFNKLIDDDFDYKSIDFGEYNHLNI